MSTFQVLFNSEVIYFLSYGIFSILGTFFHPFFFSFHLTEFLIKYPPLKNILRSVYEPYVSLILTFMVIMLLMYYATIFVYIQIYEDFNNRCNELYMCVFELFDKTFKSNGGIGGWIESNVAQDSNNYSYSRFLYENTLNIVLLIMFIKIFSAIIIDKFS